MTTSTDPISTANDPAFKQELAIAYQSLTPPTARRPANRNWATKLAAHATLILICVLALGPFLWMLSTSLKTSESATAYPPQWIPWPIRWQNYWEVLTSHSSDFLRWTRNTLIICTLVVFGTTLSSAVVAYGFSKIKFKGRGVLFAVMLSTMMVPFPVTMVSLFTLFRWIGEHTGTVWLGTYKPLWVPAWFGSAFNIFLLRQFFTTIPDDISEAARIDGCSEFGIFWRIILPLSRSALVVVALFAFLGTWNDFLGPLVYLQRPEQFTLALGLQNYQTQHGGTPWHLLMAASVLVVVPVLVLYAVAQKSFTEGISTTGMKG